MMRGALIPFAMSTLMLIVSAMSGCETPPPPNKPVPSTPPSPPPASVGAKGPVSDASSLEGKTLLGYQGWFSCPDDKTGGKGWDHWIGPNNAPAVDLVPDTSEFPQQPGCRAPFITDAKGQPVMLYSAQNPETVDVQLRWLQQYGISGFAVQRFVSDLASPVIKSSRDQVLTNVRLGAEHHGRVFFITYDISGGGSDWADHLERDWQALVASHITDSPAYLHHKGKPVVEVWGIGLSDRPAKPASAMQLMQFFTSNPDPKLRASVMAGVGVNWREQTQHENGGPSWMDVYGLASSISPWSIGTFTDAASERALIQKYISGDVAFTRAHGQVYLPVIFPGFSSYNQSHMRQKFDPRPRQCGQFMTMQTDALLELGIKSFYVAMFDEANEGTAVYKVREEPFSSPSATWAKFVEAEPGCVEAGSLFLRLIGNLQSKLLAH